MTATDWAAATLAVLSAAAACVLARLVGNFWMALNRLGAPLFCPEFFIDPGRRALIYYVPIVVLTLIAALFMPHWMLSLLLVCSVAGFFWLGSRKAYRDAVRRQADYYLEQGQQSESAMALAKRDVDASILSTKIRSGLR